MAVASRPVTLQDVANRAGVSVATASKALNDRSDVSSATRARVMQVAASLGFAPNELARSLLAGRSSTVGVLTSDLAGRFALPILMAAEDACGTGEISVFLCDARDDADREQHLLQALLSRRVDGIIVVGSRTDARPSLGRHLPVPIVYAYAPSDNPDDLSLVTDNVGGGALAIRHLVERGCRRIAHVTGDPGYGAATDRVMGVRQAMAEAGLELVGDVMFHEWSGRWGREATAALLREHPDIDGIFAGSDQVARGVIDAVRASGRAVPGDVAVIGFDNWEILATDAEPALTTVDLNLDILGRQAARHLLGSRVGTAADQPPTSGVHYLPPRLVVRDST